MHIFDADQVTKLEDIQGFNNTGNIRIWPSEECLAYLLLKNPSKVEGKRVLELGAGMTGLAGLVASHFTSSNVLLSDGNDKSVENLQRVVSRNKLGNVSTGKILWNGPTPR